MIYYSWLRKIDQNISNTNYLIINFITPVIDKLLGYEQKLFQIIKGSATKFFEVKIHEFTFNAMNKLIFLFPDTFIITR